MKAYRVLRQGVTDCLSQFSINPTAWMLLGALAGSSSGLQSSELADILNVKAPLVTVLVRALTHKDLIHTIPQPNDRRAKVIVLTQKGKHFVEKVEAAMNQELDRLLHGISRPDLEAYRRVLESIITNADSLK